MHTPVVFVGVNTVVIRDDKVLLGRRKNVTGDGFWGVPGGHLESGEKLLTGALRELKEETGLIAERAELIGIINQPDQQKNGKHYLQINFVVTQFEGEPENCEPDFCDGWEWFDMNKLPEDIFPPHKNFVKAYLEKIALIDGE